MLTTYLWCTCWMSLKIEEAMGKSWEEEDECIRWQWKRPKQPYLILLSTSSWEKQNKTLNGMKIKRAKRKRGLFGHPRFYSSIHISQIVHLLVDGFGSTAPHTYTHTHRQKWTDVQARTGTKRENYVSFWAPQQTCRQTDDYLHDKDLKYSPQKRFPLELFHYFPCVASVQASCFRHKGYFSKGAERGRLWQHICQDTTRLLHFFFKVLRGCGGSRRGRIVVFPGRKLANALQKTNMTWFMCVCSQEYTVQSLRSQTHGDRERQTHKEKIKRGVDISRTWSNAETLSLVLLSSKSFWRHNLILGHSATWLQWWLTSFVLGVLKQIE